MNAQLLMMPDRYVKAAAYVGSINEMRIALHASGPTFLSSAIREASRNGHERLIRWLLRRRDFLGSQCSLDAAAFEAARQNYGQILLWLLRRNATPKYVWDGSTCATIAVIYGAIRAPLPQTRAMLVAVFAPVRAHIQLKSLCPLVRCLQTLLPPRAFRH